MQENLKIEDFTKGKNFNDEQEQQIFIGINSGLTKEQIEIYAKEEFDREQMREIRWGFENGLSIEQVSNYAHLNISWEEMFCIRRSKQKKKSNER